jgi:hypothetical protein
MPLGVLLGLRMRGQQCQSLLELRVQGHNPCIAEHPVDLLLRQLPVALRLGPLLASGIRSRHAAAARVAAGADRARAMLRGEVPYPPIARTLNFTIMEVGPGTAVFQGTPQLNHYIPLGSVHGGCGSPPCSTRRWVAPCTR